MAYNNPLRYVDPNGHAPMSANQLHIMYAYFGIDFSLVNLNSGSAANALASRFGADAVTFGNQIYLSDAGAQDVESGSSEGLALLAHELGHVRDFARLGILPYMGFYIGQGAHHLSRGVPWGELERHMSLERSAYDIEPDFVRFLRANYQSFSTEVCTETSECYSSPTQWDIDYERLYYGNAMVSPTSPSLGDLFLSGAVCLEGICL